MTDKDILLSFIRSLTLCDHMGDVLNECQTILDYYGLKGESAEQQELSDFLDGRGVVYLHELLR